MISYYYPPLADVGALRALGFSLHLPSFGWEPYVLSIKNPDLSLCSIGDKEIPKNVKIFYSIHNDISLFLFVIPGLTRNPVFSWIPAGVYPVLDTGRE